MVSMYISNALFLTMTENYKNYSKEADISGPSIPSFFLQWIHIYFKCRVGHGC